VIARIIEKSAAARARFGIQNTTSFRQIGVRDLKD